ncbi:hypothetical protein [Nocardia terpenica]|uniref:hypothetical protein n=1 Tax=Nocardia terpenica TaxID=455432 RepID=UPI0012FE78F3|nr:hypothetical protein [Nocardia terpenica]
MTSEYTARQVCCRFRLGRRFGRVPGRCRVMVGGGVGEGARGAGGAAVVGAGAGSSMWIRGVMGE